MNEVFFNKAREFFAKLDKELGDKMKDCGECGLCCEKSQVPMRGFEVDCVFEYLYRLGRADLFEELSKLGDSWGKTGQKCIFHKIDGKRCFIFDVRPYNCRVPGPYSDEKIGLPKEDCVYAGATITVPRDKVAETLPLFSEYHGLAAEYQSYLKSGSEDKK
jgi:Fe-S-cluster containining protein